MSPFQWSRQRALWSEWRSPVLVGACFASFCTEIGSSVRAVVGHGWGAVGRASVAEKAVGRLCHLMLRSQIAAAPGLAVSIVGGCADRQYGRGPKKGISTSFP